MMVRAYYLDSPDFKPALKLYQAEEPARETWKSALESDSKGARIEDIKSFTIWQEDFNSSTCSLFEFPFETSLRTPGGGRERKSRPRCHSFRKLTSYARE